MSAPITPRGLAEKSSRPAANATPETRQPATWPADWDHVLDTAIHSWQGEWNTQRVQLLFQARYGRTLSRSHARPFLARRAHQGVFTLHEEPNRRFYTLTNRGTA